MILASSLYSIYLFSFVVPALVSAAAVEHRARQTSSSRPSPSSSLSTFSCRPSAPIKHADSDDDWYHPEYADDDDDEKEEEDEEDDAVGLDYIAYWNADRYNEDEDAEFADGGDDESDREEEELMIINGRYRAKAKGLPKARDTDANYSSILLGSNKDILSQATSSRLYGFSNNQHPVDDQGVNKSGVRIRALHARATPGRAGNSEYYRKNVNDKSITESSRATTFSRVGYSDNQHLVDDQGVDESGVRALHARATPSRVGNSDFRIGQSSGATTSSRVGYSNNQHFVNDQGVDESSVRVLPRATTALPPVNDLYSFYPYKTAVRTLPTSAHKFFGELGYHTRDFDQRMTDLTYIWYMPRKTVLATVGATKTVHRESVSTATVYVPKKETETVMVTVTTSLYIRYDQMDTFIFSKGWGAFKTESMAFRCI